MGIANAVLPSADVLPHAQKVARAFDALPPGAVRDTKKLLRQAQSAASAGSDPARGFVLRAAACRR